MSLLSPAEQSTKSKIKDALLAKLRELTIFRYVEFDTVRIKLADFLEHELPALQIIDLGTQISHERTQLRKTWTLDIEIVLITTEFGEIRQADLWDLETLIERKIGERPSLDVPRLLHLRYLGAQTDLHLSGNIYSARMTFEAIFTDGYTADI